MDVYKENPFLSTRNMDNYLHKLFKDVVNDISQTFPIFDESGSEISYLIPDPINFA